MKKSNSAGIKGLAVVLLVIAISFLLLEYVDGGGQRMVTTVIVILFLLHLFARKTAWFKPYFTSKYNFLTSKVKFQQEFDFPKELLFPKLIEVMQDAGFKIIQTDAARGNIFATTSITWFSWGENIYISMEEKNGKTTVDFCSACFFQIYSWGKNERNYGKFMLEFENSLTI